MQHWVKPEAVDCLRSGSWFGHLAPALELALLQIAKPRRLRNGETLFTRGAAHDGLYAVIEGSLWVSGVTVDGKEAILSMIEAAQWIGEISLFDGLPRTHDVVASADASLLHFPLADLEALLAREPRWWRDFGKLMAFRVRLVFIGMEDQALCSPAVRLARRLLMLLQPLVMSPAGTPLIVPISQSQLGMMLSLSRQTTNQILQSLQSQGVLQISYGRIEVVDLMKLAVAADAGNIDPQLLAQFMPATGNVRG